VKNIGTGHWIFAGLFVLAFVSYIIYAYRKDLKRSGVHYRRVYLLLIFAAIAYTLMYLLNKAFLFS